MNYFLLIIIALFMQFGIGRSSTETIITPLDMLKEEGTINGGLYKSNFYLVDFSNDASLSNVNAAINKYVDSCIKQIDGLSSLTQYDMCFYRKTESLNREVINSYPEGLKYKALLHEKTIRYFMFDMEGSPIVNNIFLCLYFE